MDIKNRQKKEPKKKIGKDNCRQKRKPRSARFQRQSKRGFQERPV